MEIVVGIIVGFVGLAAGIAGLVAFVRQRQWRPPADLKLTLDELINRITLINGKLSPLSRDAAEATVRQSRQENLEKGIALQEEGKWKESIPLLEAATDPAAEPLARFGIQFLIATAYYHMSLEAEATRRYQEQREALHAAFGRCTEAARLARQAQNNEAEAAALTNRGSALGRLGRYKEALADYDRSLVLRPNHPNTLMGRGVALGHLGRHEEALADYDRSLELRPDDPATLNNRGNALDDLGRYEEALADYNRSLELRPDHPDTLNNRGVAFRNLGRHEEALSDYNRSLELRPDHPAALNNRACAYALLNRPDDALPDLEKAIALDAKYRVMARDDTDFDTIRHDPRFQALVGGDQ